MIKIMKYGETPAGEIFARVVPKVNVEKTVSEIISDVRENGDAALFRYCEKFDDAKLDNLRVSEAEIEQAFEKLEPQLIDTLRKAAENIRAFHKNQVRPGFAMTGPDGVLLGQKVTPIDRVGLYVPGGTAAHPSTVHMDSIPAVIAGCKAVAIATPPDKEGKVNPAILAAAKIAGVAEIYKMGGAQAVAALAYGTESVPRVDKIVGPGNAFVAEAKKQVFGTVAIDMIAGPSEILIVADGQSDPANVAADLLSQAEHDRLASAVLVTDSPALAEQTAQELERQLKLLPREEIARASIEDNGKIIVAENLAQAVEVANELAPEHLELCVEDPFSWLDSVRHAGSVFLGRWCPEAVGDYFAGPNHTLPTGGTARFSSPLSVDDFVKKTQYCYYTKASLENAKESIACVARREGLEAHARSVLIRFEDDKK